MTMPSSTLEEKRYTQFWLPNGICWRMLLLFVDDGNNCLHIRNSFVRRINLAGRSWLLLWFILLLDSYDVFCTHICDLFSIFLYVFQAPCLDANHYWPNYTSSNFHHSTCCEWLFKRISNIRKGITFWTNSNSLKCGTCRQVEIK